MKKLMQRRSMKTKSQECSQRSHKTKLVAANPALSSSFGHFPTAPVNSTMSPLPEPLSSMISPLRGSNTDNLDAFQNNFPNYRVPEINLPIDYSLPKSSINKPESESNKESHMDWCNSAAPIDLSQSVATNNTTNCPDNGPSVTTPPVIQLIVIQTPQSMNTCPGEHVRSVCKIAPAPATDFSTIRDDKSAASSERLRSYACLHPSCKKTYLKSSHLKAHYRSHTGRLLF